MRIPYHQLKAEFERVLISINVNPRVAADCAAVFADNSRDGVYSHGLNRFPLFVEYIQEGLIDMNAVRSHVTAMGAIEHWDGNYGPGMLNARACMNRAMQLAAENGIGCVAIKNTNHWMRGGTYGLQAAEAGYAAICFTNTIANLPPWGGTEPRLGNNPLVIAVPRKEGPVVLDMAITQFSFGKVWDHEHKQKPLPYPGGYDSAGNLTRDAAEIIKTKRALPIGFWKGSGLSMLLDMLATLLSGGNSTAKLTLAGKKETGVSQVFICFKTDNEQNASLLEEIIAYSKTSAADGESEILYPGENMIRTRERNLSEGVLVDEEVWEKVKRM